jgi:hypothetical protein
MRYRPIAAIMALIALLLSACGGSADPTPVPTNPPTLVPTDTATPPPAPTSTPQPTDPADDVAIDDPDAEPTLQFMVEPAEGQEIDPPLDIDLPANWAAHNGTLLIQDIDAHLRLIPYTVYRGPVSGGEGFVVLLWGFVQATPGNPADMTFGEPDIHLDGLRLLRLAIAEPDCNIGTNVQRDYSVGGLPAVGTTFALVDCADTPDTRGWFAGLYHEGLNFVFYMYSEPITAMDGPAQAELQAILDTVRFRVGDLLLTATPLAAQITPTPQP